MAEVLQRMYAAALARSDRASALAAVERVRVAETDGTLGALLERLDGLRAPSAAARSETFAARCELADGFC